MSSFFVTQKNDCNIDAFARSRVSLSETVFDSKQIFDAQPLIWDDAQVSGTGTSSVHSKNTASTTLAVSNATAGNRVRQTFMRFNYQPGRSQLVMMTGVLKASGGGTGITRSLGMFDSENGIFFRDVGGTVNVGIRSFVTGAAVDTLVAQTSWNVDVLDGTGPSGITADFTKALIFFFDFEWLGVGRVRIGFVIGGMQVVCHQFLNSNIQTNVYMSSPNLPLRWEIDNNGDGAASELKHISACILSEGGSVNPTGLLFSTNQGGAVTNANEVRTAYALASIRLRSTHFGATVDIESVSVMSANNQLSLWELRLNPSVAGTFNYSGITNSACEKAKPDGLNPSENEVTGGTLLDSGYLRGNWNVEANVRKNAIRLGASIAGTPDKLVLCIIPLTADLDAVGAISWREH